MIKEVFTEIDKSVLKPTNRILCAVSGGLDSTVMLHILNEYGFECIVAHCNFQLRGNESNEDEQFVRELSAKLENRFICKHFDTESYASQTGLSIQMAARELRYGWFHFLIEEYKCDYIAIAHNSDDQCETIITNLIRGTGIRGMTAMSFLKNIYFRPLIYTSREDIVEIAKLYDTTHREDSTNKTTKYSRNKIRHQIIPLMQEINPSCKQNILKSIQYFTDTEEIFNTYVNQIKNKCLSYINNKTIIDINELKQASSYNTVLFEILVNEGIPKVLASEALHLIDSQAGKSVKFLNVQILKDRDTLIIDKTSHHKKEDLQIIIHSIKDLEKLDIRAKITDKSDMSIIKDQNFAYIDADKIKFPLVYRFWEDGDKFKPFGMNNYKKLSDFFRDEKLNLFEKNEIPILESEGEIIWIVGIRIDNRFRIDKSTKSVLIMEKS